jgi:hypothetical protein
LAVQATNQELFELSFAPSILADGISLRPSQRVADQDLVIEIAPTPKSADAVTDRAFAEWAEVAEHGRSIMDRGS